MNNIVELSNQEMVFVSGGNAQADAASPHAVMRSVNFNYAEYWNTAIEIAQEAVYDFNVFMCDHLGWYSEECHELFSAILLVGGLAVSATGLLAIRFCCLPLLYMENRVPVMH